MSANYIRLLFTLLLIFVMWTKGAGVADPGDEPVYDKTGWPDKLVIAYPTIGTEKQTIDRHQSLNAFLEARLGIRIEPVVTNGYIPIYKGFNQKTMDVAYMGPLSYIELCKYAPTEPAVMELTPGGQAGYHAIIIAKAGSGIESLEQGKGKVMAMVSKYSTSGFLIPTMHFLRTMNTSPGVFASKVEFAGTHDDVIKGVAEQKYDLGATNDIDLARACNEQGFSREAFVVLWKSEPYPASPYAMRKDLPETLKKAYRESMLAVNDRPEIIADLGIGGFVTVEDVDYNSVRILQSIMK